jgi:tetratricopeptide (TPR) repeat protein
LKRSDPRALFVSHICTGHGHQVNGDFLSAIESFKRAVEVSVDPYLNQWGNLFLGWCYLETFEVDEAEKILSEVISFDNEFQSKQVGSAAQALLPIVNVMRGNLSQGIEILKVVKQALLENGRKFGVAVCDYNFGKIYSELAGGGQNVTFSMVAKNLGFLIKNVPFATKKADEYFQSAIHQFNEIGSKGWVGRASLDLGRLHKMKGRTDQARKYISDAIELFKECEADGFLKQAKEELASL